MHARLMCRFSPCFVAALALCVCACREPSPKREWRASDHGQPPIEAPANDDEATAASDGEDTSVRAARALFVAACAGCHGRDGRGQGDARPPGAQLPDFTVEAWQTTRSDAQLAQTIRDGRGMMPA